MDEQSQYRWHWHWVIDTRDTGLTTDEEALLIDTCGSGFGVDDLVPVMDENLHNLIGTV